MHFGPASSQTCFAYAFCPGRQPEGKYAFSLGKMHILRPVDGPGVHMHFPRAGPTGKICIFPREMHILGPGAGPGKMHMHFPGLPPRPKICIFPRENAYFPCGAGPGQMHMHSRAGHRTQDMHFP